MGAKMMGAKMMGENDGGGNDGIWELKRGGKNCVSQVREVISEELFSSLTRICSSRRPRRRQR